jgi:hypothetical protein
MEPFLKLVPAGLLASASPALPSELSLWLERALGAGGAARVTLPGGSPDPAGEVRDAVLRALAQRFFPFVPVSTQVSRLHALAEAYGFVNWPRDRERTQIPARHRGLPDEYLWAAYKSGAPMPLPRRELRRILMSAAETEG